MVSPGDRSEGMAAAGGSAMHVWWDPPADGPTNMALDEALAAEACLRGGVVVRVSTWNAAALSLGAFQSLAEARRHPRLGALPIVRRPSGGGAILHGSDVTLAVAVPRDHPAGGSPQALYDIAHLALVAELRSRGVDAGLSPGEREVAGVEAPLLCFDRRATGDVVVPTAHGVRRDSKILGSAQRRLKGAILQHGSLLLAASPGLPGDVAHPGLEELAGPHGPWALPGGLDVVRGWVGRLAAGFGLSPVGEPGPFRPSAGSGFDDNLVRFRGDDWNARR